MTFIIEITQKDLWTAMTDYAKISLGIPSCHHDWIRLNKLLDFTPEKYIR